MSQPLKSECVMQPNINEAEVAQTGMRLKEMEQKVIHVSKQSQVLNQAVEHLQHKLKLLDKQVIYNESFTTKVQQDIKNMKRKTQKAALEIQNVRWKIFKTNMLRQLESELNEAMHERKSNLLEVVENPGQNEKDIDKDVQHNSSYEIQQLRDKVKKLSEQIYTKNRVVLMTDSKLFTDIQKLEKRNTALQLRYQRQHQEAESRYRQRISELNSLQKLLAEKNM